MSFRNSYEDDSYAAAYAKLGFPGTYYLAFRDLPEVFSQHIRGDTALDLGCGAGRSTRYLRSLGFDAIGVDIAEEMVRRARVSDPEGDYRLVADGDLGQFSDQTFDLGFAAFPFDNIPTSARKIILLRELARVLKPNGRIVNLVSSPKIYLHEWVSFTTKDFPENQWARCGDEVRIINTALEDGRPAVDILWSDEDYHDVYGKSDLRVIEVRSPLGNTDDPYEWVNETTIAPWVIYVLGKA